MGIVMLLPPGRHCHVPGRDTGQRLISAHIVIGAMVKEIKSNGMLQLTNIGGWAGPMSKGKLHRHHFFRQGIRSAFCSTKLLPMSRRRNRHQ